MEPHIKKATINRQLALAAIKTATTKSLYESVMNEYADSPLSKEGMLLSFDTHEFPLREVLLESCGLSPSTDLSRLHDNDATTTATTTTSSSGVPSNKTNKLQLLENLTKQQHSNNNEFQTVYDNFVRKVCCPKLAELWDCQGDIYYQCFPTLRIVQPGDFSIGPHCDVTYGLHPLTTNFYVLLTDLEAQESSAAMFLESKPGAEDWHPILGKYGEMVKHFPGGICAHWTTENNTDMTRVSLDLRLIPGPLYHVMVNGGGEKGGRDDVFRKTEGYFSRCQLVNKQQDGDDNNHNKKQWERVGPLLMPDARVGFPWTVSNWEKLFADQERQRTASNPTASS